MESAYIDLKSQRMHYLSGGSGKVIVLLPSSAVSSRSYEALGSKLTTFYRVLIPDIHKGRSKSRRLPESVGDYADALEEFRIAMGIKKFNLIGTSGSGLTAVEYGIRHGNNILHVLLLSTTVVIPDVGAKLFRMAMGYVRLTLDYLFPFERLKIDLLWYRDALLNVLSGPKRFMREFVTLARYRPTGFTELPVRTKLIFAHRDEFFPQHVLLRNRQIRNLEIETVAGDHCWFFLRKDEFISYVREYFG